MTLRERIRGRLVSLAPLSVESAELFARWLNDAETTRYLFGRGRRPKGPFTVDAERRWARRMLADPRHMVFAIEDAEGSVIGNSRLGPLGRSRATFGIMIGEPSARGHGKGTEATALVCRYGFERLGLRAIELSVHPANVAAVRAYRRVGFEPLRGERMLLRDAPSVARLGAPPDAAQSR
jgi:RimJ/RimL family protein N-acetyltransferase